jgi:hypothetical protein
MVMHLAARRLSGWVPTLWLSALAINVGMNVLLLRWGGVMAAAMTSSLAYSVLTVGILILFLKETGSKLRDAIVPQRADWRKILCRPRKDCRVAS